MDDSSYHVYKNVEFIIWKEEQKLLKEEKRSFLSSLNESRDDSIDSSLYLNQEHLSKISNDDSSDWNSQSNYDYLNQVPSSVDGMSDVTSVFKMGTEKFMGSEKHYMSENFEIPMTNTEIDDESSAVDSNGQRSKRRIRRVNRRKDGPVKVGYTGQVSVPIEKPQNKLNTATNKRSYLGAASYTGPKNDAIISENEIANAKNIRLHDYLNNKEGQGVPLEATENKTSNKETKEPQQMSFFAAMENSEK